MNIPDTQIVLDTEAYLGHWAESLRSSNDVTDASAKFFFADDDDVKPLVAMQCRKGKGKREPGKRFRLILIELDDDENAVTQTNMDLYRDKTPGELCREAIDYCAAPMFQQFAAEVLDAEGTSAHFAKKALCRLCRIATRKALDHDAEAAARYDAVIQNYRGWLRERQTTQAPAQEDD